MKILKILSIIILIQISSPIYSQKNKSIDKLEYKCTYKLSYISNPTESTNVLEENMILLVGKKTSKFLSQGKYLRDSISLEINKKTIKAEEISSLYSKVPATFFTYKIIKNYPRTKITVTEQLLNKHYKYEENLNLFKWKITKQTNTIGNYVCTKALLKFAGREYTAWFTKSIKIKDGPYKFCGLPGLIVKISDSQNHYTYLLTDIKKTNNNEEIFFKEKKYLKTHKNDFLKTRKVFFKEIQKKIELSCVGISEEDKIKYRNRTNRFVDMKNPIEIK